MKIFKYMCGLLLAGILLQGFSGFNPVKQFNNEPFKSAGCPVIDISNKIIIQPACNQSNGSIKGIIITSSGTKKFYTWRDAQNNVVGHAIDLGNIPSGVYTLEVTDNSGCTSSVFSPQIVVLNANAITIDDSGEQMKPESCNGDGAITGITVTGATTLEWHNTTTGAIVSTSSTSADLVNVPHGTYQLFAYNSTCQLTSQFFTVNLQLQVPSVVDFQILQPTCAGDGNLTVTLNVQPNQPKLQFFFLDFSGRIVGNGIILGGIPNPILHAYGLDGGDYSLFVENNNNCRVLIKTFHLNPGGITILHSESVVVNDKCDQHLGSVRPVVTGLTPPTKTARARYIWTDINSHQVVGTAQELDKVGAGTYSVKVIDVFFCTAIDTFTVINIAPALIPPKAAGTTLCLPGMINITVTNANIDTSTTFKLYGAVEDTIPLEVNRTGVFYRHVDKTTDFYLTRSNGTCESERTKVTETVVADIKIPNAFTPNNDGVNDYWNIAGIEKFPGADISVFSRSGQLVFHSINYAITFNGTFKGARLPVGVYYYIIDVRQPICFGKIAGSLTIIR